MCILDNLCNLIFDGVTANAFLSMQSVSFASDLNLYRDTYYSTLGQLTLIFFLLRSTLLCSALLYSILLYSTLLYSTLLYSTLLYSTPLTYSALITVLLYYNILYYTILYYTILYYTILYYTILYYTILTTIGNHGKLKSPAAPMSSSAARKPFLV